MKNRPITANGANFRSRYRMMKLNDTKSGEILMKSSGAFNHPSHDSAIQMESVGIKSN
jgi:hypothetical protein